MTPVNIGPSSCNVPADGTKFPPVLHHSMEEAKAKEQGLEDFLRFGEKSDEQMMKTICKHSKTIPGMDNVDI